MLRKISRLCPVHDDDSSQGSLSGCICGRPISCKAEGRKEQEQPSVLHKASSLVSEPSHPRKGPPSTTLPLRSRVCPVAVRPRALPSPPLPALRTSHSSSYPQALSLRPRQLVGHSAQRKSPEGAREHWEEVQPGFAPARPLRAL